MRDSLPAIEVINFSPILQPDDNVRESPLCQGFPFLLGKEPLKSSSCNGIRSRATNFPSLERRELNWQTCLGKRADGLALTQEASRAPSFQFVDHRAQLLPHPRTSRIARAAMSIPLFSSDCGA